MTAQSKSLTQCEGEEAWVVDAEVRQQRDAGMLWAGKAQVTACMISEIWCGWTLGHVCLQVREAC